jgi:hypothetical protein
VDTGVAQKQRGNEAFAKGEWTAAIKHYGAAIDAPVSYQGLFDEAPRRAVYHANRAAAYLARGASPGGKDWRQIIGRLGDCFTHSLTHSVIVLSVWPWNDAQVYSARIDVL